MKPEDCGPVGVSVESMLRSKTLSSDMKDRISKADVNGDGVLSIDELVEGALLSKNYNAITRSLTHARSTHRSRSF